MFGGAFNYSVVVHMTGSLSSWLSWWVPAGQWYWSWSSGCGDGVDQPKDSYVGERCRKSRAQGLVSYSLESDSLSVNSQEKPFHISASASPDVESSCEKHFVLWGRTWEVFLLRGVPCWCFLFAGTFWNWVRDSKCLTGYFSGIWR